MLEHHPDPTLTHLGRILPAPLRSCHDSILSRVGAVTDPGALQYPYYFCVGRHQKRNDCTLKARPIELVDRQIEDHFQGVALSALGLEATGTAILEELQHEQQNLVEERKRQEERLRQLDDERMKLLQAHYAGAVPLDLLKREQDRIGKEIGFAEKALAAQTGDSDRVEATVRKATAWAENCHDAYLRAEPVERKLINQAFFSRILVTEEGVVGWEYNEPFATLMDAHGAPSGKPSQGTETRVTPETDGQEHAPRARTRHTKSEGYKRTSPGPGWSWTQSVALGLKAARLAEGVGFEPTEACTSHAFEACPFGRSGTLPGSTLAVWVV
jgi:hypothetical protein